MDRVPGDGVPGSASDTKAADRREDGEYLQP